MPKFNEDKQIQPLNGLGKTNGLANTWGYAQTPIKKKKKRKKRKKQEKRKKEKGLPYFPELSATFPSSLLYITDPTCISVKTAYVGSL